MKRVFKILMISALSACLLLIAAWYMLRPYFSGFLMHQLQRELRTTFGEYYHLRFQSFTTDITSFSFSVKFYKPQLITDTTQYEELAKYPPIYFKADSFEVTGISIRKLLTGSTLSLGEIQLHNPALVVLLKKHHHHGTQNDTKKKIKTKKIITNIELSRLAILKGHVNLIRFDELNDTVYFGNDINLEVTGLDIPTQTTEGIYRSSSIHNLRFSMKDVNFSPEKLHYEYRMKSINIDLKKDIFECSDINLLPEKSLRSMSQDEAYQKTFAKIRLGHLSFSGFGYHKLIDKQLHIRSIHIGNAQVSLFRNKGKAFDKRQVKETFQRSLREIPLAFKIDSVLIHNMSLIVQILFPDHKEPATIPITRINGALTNINTMQGSTGSMKLALNARIMKTGKLSFNAHFPVRTQSHSYHARVHAMPFHEWNDVLGNIANIRIESGTINGINLKGTCTDDETRGLIVFTYNDLKCGVYRRKNDGGIKRSGLLSWGGNMLIRHHNPGIQGEKPVEKPVYFKRHHYQGQIALWVGGLLDGMLATMLNERVKEEVDKMKAKKQH